MSDTTQAQELCKTAAVAIRHLAAENHKLAHALAAYQRRDLAEEVVQLMEDRGMLDDSISHKQKVAQVLSSKRDLTTMREALKCTPADMSFASVSTSETDRASTDPFVAAILD